MRTAKPLHAREVLRSHGHVGAVDELCDTVVAWVTTPDEHYAWTGFELKYPPTSAALHAVGSSTDRSRSAYGLYDSTDGLLLGYGELGRIDRANRTARLDRLILDPEHRGRGLGSVGVRMIAAEGFACGLHRIELLVGMDNIEALRAYRQAGFVLEGTLHDARLVKGEYCSMYLMAKIDDRD